jgi:hypothetical protein
MGRDSDRTHDSDVTRSRLGAYPIGRVFVWTPVLDVDAKRH